MNPPDRGVRLLLITALLLPVEFLVGETAFSLCFFFTAFLFVAWLLRLIIVERQIVVHSSRVVIATLFFMAASILSFLVGQYPWFPIAGAPIRAQLGGLALFVLSGGVLLMVAHQTRTLARLRGLTWLFIGVGGVTLVAMFLPATEITLGRVRVLTHGSVGSLFFTWLVAMSVSQAIWNRSLSTSARALLLLIAAATLGRGVFVTFGWASGWLPPLIALGIVLLFRFPRLTISAGLLLIVPAAVVAGLAWSSLMEGESWSWLTRVEAQRVLLQVIAREPVLGLGPANYPFYTHLFPILGYRIRFNSHNNFTDFLAQGGIVGLIVFGWLACEALRLAHRMSLRAPDGFCRAYAMGTFSGVASSLAAGLLADWIVPFVYNIGIVGFRSSLLFWFFVGGLVAMKRLTDMAAVPAVVTRPSFGPAWASTTLARAGIDAHRMATANRVAGARARTPGRAASMPTAARDVVTDVSRAMPGFEGVDTLKALFAEGGPVAGLGQRAADTGGMRTPVGASPARGGEGS